MRAWIKCQLNATSGDDISIGIVDREGRTHNVIAKAFDVAHNPQTCMVRAEIHPLNLSLGRGFFVARIGTHSIDIGREQIAAEIINE